MVVNALLTMRNPRQFGGISRSVIADIDSTTSDPQISSELASGAMHVPEHQDAVQLRAAGDRGRDPRVGAAIRAQALRLHASLEGQSGGVRARGRRGDRGGAAAA